jgi:Fe-S cluster biogenesis protein NfuA
MEMIELEAVARGVVQRVDRMVRRDGGAVTLIGVEGGVLRIGYRPGVDLDCAEGVCVLPEVELQAMMTELLAPQAPDLRVRVERTA